MKKNKTEEQIYRYRKSSDEFPDRLLFESRYFAVKYLQNKLTGLDDMHYIIQTDPFKSEEGFVILLLTYV